MKIDSHQHFWQFEPVRDAWITEDMAVIKKDFLPDDLKPILEKNGIDGCVAVQADQSESETEFLLDLAENNPFIKGIVGWVNLKSDDLNERLSHYKQRPAFKGVRHILQAEGEGFMLDSGFIRGIGNLYKNDLSYDILTHQKQLKKVIKLIPLLPEMRLVIDHISKPNIKNKSFDHWARHMKQISIYGHVYVKLSGMATEADWKNWTNDDLKPYIDFCLAHFGPERLMFGSDWPVCLVAASYDRIYQSMLDCLKELSGDEQNMILGGTASNFYRLT